MLVGLLVVLVVAGIFGLASEQSVDETDLQVVQIYGDAIGASVEEWHVIRREALEWANGVCTTDPSKFAESWANTVPPREAALEVAAVRCPDLVDSFVADVDRSLLAEFSP